MERALPGSLPRRDPVGGDGKFSFVTSLAGDDLGCQGATPLEGTERALACGTGSAVGGCRGATPLEGTESWKVILHNDDEHCCRGATPLEGTERTEDGIGFSVYGELQRLAPT